MGSNSRTRGSVRPLRLELGLEARTIRESQEAPATFTCTAIWVGHSGVWGLKLRQDEAGGQHPFINALAPTLTDTHTDSSTGVTSASFFFPLSSSLIPFSLSYFLHFYFTQEKEKAPSYIMSWGFTDRNPSKWLFTAVYRSCPSLTSASPSGLNPQPPETTVISPRLQPHTFHLY